MKNNIDNQLIDLFKRKTEITQVELEEIIANISTNLKKDEA